MPGGQPSTTQPIASPWLSPQVVMRKRWPKLLKDMGSFRSVSALRQAARTLAQTSQQSVSVPAPRPSPRRREGSALLLHHGDVGGVFVLHADNVVAGVDMQDLAGDAAPEIGQEIERARADILDRHRAPERRVVFVPFEDVAEVGDARGGERLDRSGRYGVRSEERRVG